MMDENNLIKFTITSEDQLSSVASEFLERLKGYKVFAFFANMGVGKTTFIRALCLALGVEEDTVNSPTFSIINEYVTRGNQKIFHFDCYRLSTIQDALNIGAEDYLDSSHFCFIEWPEVLMPILPQDAIVVEIEVQEDGARQIIVHQ